jgi:hypothetical protein
VRRDALLVHERQTHAIERRADLDAHVVHDP